MNAQYGRIAEIRGREVGTRVGLAAFIMVTVWALAPSKWPFVWFGCVVAGQLIDHLVFSRIRAHGANRPTASVRLTACATLFANGVIYNGIAAYLWATGGGSQMVFGSVLVAGALLHVTIHLYHEREVLISAVIPPAVYFLALPLAHGIATSQATDLLVAVGCLLYMAHLVVAVRQSSQTNHAIQVANEEAQAERDRAEIASAAKSDFLAVVSHEIRTPMNAVVNSANLLERSTLDATQREQVVMLREASEVLIGLLNDVLDFSKIEAGKMQLEETTVDLVAKLEALERMWSPKASANGVAFELRLAANLPHHVRTDPLRLQQILFNLISNAVKFTGSGKIEVLVDWDESASRLDVAVADTGCGIPEDRLPYVFDLFEQVDAGVTRRHGGTGLGLAITCKLAELMRGSISVESRPGIGSTFSLRVPMAVVAAPDRPTIESTATPLSRPLQILVVDDHPMNRKIVGMLLEPLGFVLTYAEDGLQAVDHARVQNFDAILMDMQMPVMDGLTATTTIRDRGRNRTTPVIALTANALDTHRAAWAAIGVVDFLTKPIEPARLISTLEDAVTQNEADPEAIEPATNPAATS